MNKLSRKLLVSLLLLIFSVFALGTATFAWFSLSDTATVSQFDANISSSEGIEVSLGDSNPEFYTNIPIDAVNNFLNGAGYGVNFRMNHITSPDGKSFESLNGTQITSPSAGGYIEFPMRIRSTSANVPIYLAVGTGLSSEPKNWVADIEFKNSQGTTVYGGDANDYYIANAARFSISSVVGGTETVMVIYELPEYAYGNNTDTQYGNRVLGTTPQLEGAVHYYNQKKGFTSYPEEDYDGLVYTGKTLPATDTSVVGLPSIVTLGTNTTDGYFYALIKVRVWIEGWDPDCFDALYGTKLKIDLKFTTEKPQ